jgi:hypothetical protein
MLRTSFIPLALGLLAWAQVAWAQQADEAVPRDGSFGPRAGQVVTSGVVTPTPEMWFYEQQISRHDDVKLAIRRRAEQRAQQRADRLAAQKWYGVSNARPMAWQTPATSGIFAGYWGSNSYEPNRWRPVAPTIIVARPTEGPY